jgi:predicted DNA-binding transcriptional regulator YafY
VRSMGSKSSTSRVRCRRSSTSELTPSARSAYSTRSRWRWCFASRHPPRRTLSDEPDGSLTVRFRAGGFLEMAHHLMTWGPSVTIVAPKALEDRMRELVAAVHAHYCGTAG